jgi:hypothetical protein
MGNTLKLLAERELPERTPGYGRMVVDLCENIHIHRRELRQEFTLPEFFEHLANLNRYAEKVCEYLRLNPEYEEQVYRDALLICGPDIIRESPKPNESAYFPNRLRIELEHPHSMGEAHVHWRDYRLHLTLAELRTMVEAFKEAGEALDAYLSKNRYRPKPKATMEQVERTNKEAPMPGAGHFKRMAK